MSRSLNSEKTTHNLQRKAGPANHKGRIAGNGCAAAMRNFFSSAAPHMTAPATTESVVDLLLST